jgi:hypothetical protein
MRSAVAVRREMENVIFSDVLLREGGSNDTNRPCSIGLWLAGQLSRSPSFTGLLTVSLTRTLTAAFPEKEACTS